METLKVIKIGGNIIDDERVLASFLANYARLKGPKIIVHGGGKFATKMANQMQVAVKMIEGRRITDAATLDIITMVYAGKINKNIVAKLQANKCNAMGLSGADGNAIVAVKRPAGTHDFGFVGDVVKVNIASVNLLLQNNLSPVFCAITHDENGQLLNTNADTIASEIASAFAHEYQTELYYCFDKKGVLENINDDDSVIEHINSKNYQSLIDQRIITDGMLPKLSNCFNAIAHRVNKVCIGLPEMLFDPNAQFTTIQR